MKKILLLISVLFASSLILAAYPVYYKEQYYKLYHIHYIQYPDDSIENIFWLEKAIEADFANPLYALAKIGDKKSWERYRYLFNMHLELKMIEQHLALGSKFDKREAFFFNAPWKRENLDSLKTAETAYKAALSYWPKAKEWANKAENIRFLYLPEVQFWEDEATRIVQGSLDYDKIITKELDRLNRVKLAFEGMDEASY